MNKGFFVGALKFQFGPKRANGLKNNSFLSRLQIVQMYVFN